MSDEEVQVTSVPPSKYTIAIKTVISLLEHSLVLSEAEQKSMIASASYLLRVVADE